jgi:putative SOS response-associated peptidase YedK
MCGRYARFTPQEAYTILFRAHGIANLSPPYNVAPSQAVLVPETPNGATIGT